MTLNKSLKTPMIEKNKILIDDDMRDQSVRLLIERELQESEIA